MLYEQRRQAEQNLKAVGAEVGDAHETRGDLLSPLIQVVYEGMRAGLTPKQILEGLLDGIEDNDVADKID